MLPFTFIGGFDSLQSILLQFVLAACQARMWEAHIILGMAGMSNGRPSRENADKAGRSELHYAVVDRNLERVKELIRQGMSVNLADRNGWPPCILRRRTTTRALLVFCLIPAHPLIPEY